MNFHSAFKKKYLSSKVSRKLNVLLRDEWCTKRLDISPNLFCDPINDVIQMSEDITEVEMDSAVEDQYQFSQAELCEVMNQIQFDFADSANQVTALKDHILSKLSLTDDDLADDAKKELEKQIKNFVGNMKVKHKQYFRNFPRLKNFFKKDKGEENVFKLSHTLSNKLKKKISSKIATRPNPPEKLVPLATQDKTPAVGRPRKSFEEKSKRGQQYESAKIREDHEPGAIFLAASQQPTELGDVVKKCNSIRGVTVKKALAAISKPTKPSIIPKTPSEALAYLLSNDLTKDQYNSMKVYSRESFADIWPNYNKLLEAKYECRPEGIAVQELSACVPLQNLLDHTTKRIILGDLDLAEKIQDLAVQNNGKLEIIMYYKYGFDGCGSFNTAMQRDESGKVPDATTLMTSQMVPLQSYAVVNGKRLLVHNSSTPNNANACRPIRLSFERETKEAIRREADRLRGEVDNMSDLVLMEDPQVTVTYKGIFSMVDGKVLSELTNAPASSCCPVCHKTSR
jgi:hypothetical protein